MGRRFTKIPESTFNELQINAGVVLKRFDPEDPVISTGGNITEGFEKLTVATTLQAPAKSIDINEKITAQDAQSLAGKSVKIGENSYTVESATMGSGSSKAQIKTKENVSVADGTTGNAVTLDSDIVCATTGGITVTCKPTFNDYGSDIDNVPDNTKELLQIDGYDCSLGFTALNVTEETLRLSLGAADVVGGKIVPRMTPNIDKDFKNVWWVGDRTDGSFVAVCLKNAMSSDGLSLKTTKNGKGQLSVTLKGFVTIKNVDDVPMSFYIGQEE